MALCGCKLSYDHRVSDCPVMPGQPDGHRPMRDRGRETSNALVSVRTVLSRAETALYELETQGEYGCDEEGRIARDSNGLPIRMQDEDYDEMRSALEHVVESLDWWRRTGRPRKEKP